MIKEKYNLVTLSFPGKTEKEFLQYAIKQDLGIFRVILLSAGIVALSLVLIEVIRDPGNYLVIISRICLFLYLSISYLVSGMLRGKSILSCQIFFLFSLNFVFWALLAIYHYSGVYELFMFNNMAAYVYVVFAVGGLKFRHSFWLILGVIGIYIVYSMVNDITINIQQLPSIFSHFVLGGLIAYFLERSRRDSFLSWKLIQEQTEEINHQKEELLNLNHIKNTLLSVLSHDLKAPFNSLKGILSLLEYEELKKEDLERMKSQIGTRMQNTDEFIQRVLHWTKNQMGGFEMKFETIQIHQLIHDNIHLIRENMNGKMIELENSVSEDTQIVGDVETINIVIRNILNNAIKYSPDQSKIQITQEEDPVETVICIKDEGRGIEKEKLETLFDINKKISEDSGTGLGLVLSKEFMERNGGRLKVLSKEGSGTTVKMYFESK